MIYHETLAISLDIRDMAHFKARASAVTSEFLSACIVGRAADNIKVEVNCGESKQPFLSLSILYCDYYIRSI